MNNELVEALIAAGDGEFRVGRMQNNAILEAAEFSSTLLAGRQNLNAEQSAVLDKCASEVRFDLLNIAYEDSSDERRRVGDSLRRVFEKEVRWQVGIGRQMMPDGVFVEASEASEFANKALGRLVEEGVDGLKGAGEVLYRMWDLFQGEVKIEFLDFKTAPGVYDHEGKMVEVTISGTGDRERAGVSLFGMLEGGGATAWCLLKKGTESGGGLEKDFRALSERDRMVVMYAVVAGCVNLMARAKAQMVNQ